MWLEKSEDFNDQVGVTFKLLFFFSFLTMKTTVLRTFEYTVKVK